VFLRNLRIEYCDHCEVCDHEERCSHDDDFWPVYQKMKAVSTIVVFTSVTSGMMNPKLSALLLRAGRIARKHADGFRGRLSGSFLEEFSDGGELVQGQLRIWFRMMRMLEPVETRVRVGRGVDGRHSPQGGEQEAKRFDAARELGKKLMWKLAT